MSDSSFINRMRKRYPDIYCQTDDPNYPLLKQFFIDHKELILESSKIISLTPQDMFFTQFRLTEYLLDNNIDPSATWIILMINDLDSTLDFRDLSNFYLPDPHKLNDLYRDYLSYISIYNK